MRSKRVYGIARILTSVRFSAARLVAIACAAAALFALAGVGLEVWRFGLSEAAAASRLEHDVRTRFAERSRDVQSLAERVARDTAALTDAAARQPDDLPALFDRLNALAPEATGGSPSATVTLYVKQPENQFRILAWSDGPAEDIPADRLGGDAALLIVPGTLGLRLVSVQPILFNGKRIAAAAAETVLAPAMGIGQPSGAYEFDTNFGQVTVSYPTEGEAAHRSDRFAVMTAHGTGFDVQVSSKALQDARHLFRRRALAIAAVPLVVMALLLTGVVVGRRRGTRNLRTFLSWSALGLAVLAASGVVSAWLAHLASAPAPVALAIEGFVALAAAAFVPLALWWRGVSRVRPGRFGVRFVLEQLGVGLITAAAAWFIAERLRQQITPASLVEWQRPLFPLRLEPLAYLAGLFLTELALFWTAAALLAIAAGRWRLRAHPRPAWLAASVLWFGPAAALCSIRSGHLPGAAWPWLPAMATAIAFAVGSRMLRIRYRATTQAMRLVLLYGFLLAPVLALYPVAWFYADSSARQIVADSYAPETMRRPAVTLDVLTRVTHEIDAISSSRLTQLLAVRPDVSGGVPPLPAFDVWSQTSLATTRVTAAIELYDAAGALVSRFALNMPEYQTGVDTNTRSLPTSCSRWDTFGEAVPFGAEERHVLHARRQLCDAAGQSVGAVFVHVMNDYRALPFVSTPDPYREMLRSPDSPPRGSILPDLQLVVYGWSFTPLFTSGNVAWPITPALFDRLYRSREPFWTKLDAEGHSYDVHFSNDSGFIYALGYPSATWFEHLTRLAEAAAFLAIVFVLWLLGATLYTPLARVAPAPLGALIDEIRTSFYRKLFLFFVLAAVGPVLIFALAFGVYLTAKLRADVETEAATVVTVARRVLEQTSAPGLRPGTLDDDVMVWVGQVLRQDVNLFEGAELLATSQRDLYASGLLPTRTPAKVYRAIALNRLPSFVGEEWLGPVSYLVAAAPVPTAGRGFVLSVPLATRQREIEREIDELSRGVLVGAVFVVLFAAGLGASVAGRVSDPVARLSRATRLIAAGHLDVRLVAETSDELSRLIEDFNSMTATLSEQRAELARANQLEAWAEMARQVAHDIKNPLTPIQLAAEHLEHVHADQGRPLGATFDQCVGTVLRQVRLLRQIASEFSNFAGRPTPRFSALPLRALIAELVDPYRVGLRVDTRIELDLPDTLPDAWADRTLVSRALTNLIENALQAMPAGGTLRIAAGAADGMVTVTVSDTGVGMEPDAAARAFEPYYSTKTGGSGLGLANARRNIETCGGTIELASEPGRGTTVTVTLPADDSSGGREPASTPSR
jgi:signal transduction histidine kinase